MRFRRMVIVGLLLAGCGGLTRDSRTVLVNTSRPMVSTRHPRPRVVAASETRRRNALAYHRFLVGLAFHAWISAERRVVGIAVGSSPPQAAEPSAAVPAVWTCIADAETGGDYSMHGPTYSSAYGVLNAAVSEYAVSPASATRILSGTASAGEETAMATNLAHAVGFGGWGALTRAKCGLS